MGLLAGDAIGDAPAYILEAIRICERVRLELEGRAHEDAQQQFEDLKKKREAADRRRSR